MNPLEIKAKVDAGEMTMDQARAAFAEERERRVKEGLTHSKIIPPQPQARPEIVETHQIQDRQALARVRLDLAQVIANQDAEHYAARTMVEERARHAVGLFAYGLIGLADGVADSVGYGISELAEDVSFTVARTVNRIRQGWYRGLHS